MDHKKKELLKAKFLKLEHGLSLGGLVASLMKRNKKQEPKVLN